MFWKITAFEVRFWLRSWMLWMFFLGIMLLIFGAVSTDQVQVGAALSNTYRNAPFVIQNYYAIIGLLTLLMATAFVNSAALRDFKYNTYQILFTTPMRRRDFLLARFLGATAVSVIPMMGVSAGILLAKYMPWVDPERWDAVHWAAHLKGIYVFALPNAFFMAAILFAIAVLARKEVLSFVGALVLLVGYVIGDGLLQDIQHEKAAALLDPFAIRTFALVTKYWTVAEKNTQASGLTDLMLWNRLIWVTVGLLIFGFAYWRFSFAERRSKARPVEKDAQEAIVPVAVPALKPQLRDAPWAKFLGSLKIHFLGMAKSTFFIVIGPNATVC